MRRIGRYAILGLLGRGGMGAVYKAAMPHTCRVAALKLLKPSDELAAVLDWDTLRRNFFREARLMGLAPDQLVEMIHLLYTDDGQ